MDDRLLPRQVPEPTRFPSAIFEPCVPDASLVFGCGLFEAPTASAEVTKPPQKTASGEDFLHRGTLGTGIPSWIKAYGVEKRTGVDICNSERSDRKCSSSEDSEKRADFQVSETKSPEYLPGSSNSGLVRACVGQKTCEVDTVRHENAAPVPETAATCEKFVNAADGHFSKGTGGDTFIERFRYSLKGSEVTNLQTPGEISEHRASERQEGVGPEPWRSDAVRPGKSGFPARVLPVDRPGSTVSSVVTESRRPVRDVTERSSILPGHADRPVGPTRRDNPPVRFSSGDHRVVPSEASAPRPPRTEFRKRGDKFPEPQRGFISSDCSLSDYPPLDSGRRRGKWKNKLAKESERMSVSYEGVGRSARERDPRALGTSKVRGSPGRAKRRDAAEPPSADFGNVAESGGARVSVSVSDPLIRALFHLQNRHTELLLQLAADVSEVALKQKRMFDVFQRLQSAFCDGGTRSGVEASPAGGRGRGRRCDKCTQTDCDAGRVPRDSADASTQSDRTRGADGGRTTEASRPGSDGTPTVAGGFRTVPKNLGVEVVAADEAAGSLVETGSRVAERSESGVAEAEAGPGAPAGGGETCGGTLDPGDVRRLIGAVRSIAARVEDSGGNERRPIARAGTGSREADEGRGERPRRVEAGGPLASVRGVVSRYKNNDFIKAPDLEDVAEASENSSDSEGGEVSETGDESLTIGDLSLVPQNVSLSPNASLRIDPRGLEVSSDALATGSEDSDTEQSARCSTEKGDRSENTDMTAIYLYRNIFSKVQEILEHNKTAEESRRESAGKKPPPEAESGRARTRSH